MKIINTIIDAVCYCIEVILGWVGAVLNWLHKPRKQLSPKCGDCLFKSRDWGYCYKYHQPTEYIDFRRRCKCKKYQKH